MTELKPCPFCGGEAEFFEDVWSDNEICYVQCVDCRASTNVCDTQDEAVAKWNTRPNPWHTGTPTEEGWYLVVLPICEQVYRYESDYFNKAGKWRLYTNQVIAWRKIEPFEETD